MNIDDIVGHKLPWFYATEKHAEKVLEQLLNPYFFLLRQVRLQHLITGQNMPIDYLAAPRPTIPKPFPFPWFGIECKTGKGGRNYNQAIKQASDYVNCRVCDTRWRGQLTGKKVERVYLFPGLRDGDKAEIDPGVVSLVNSVNRLAGQYHVGQIVIRIKHRADRELPNAYPAFYMSADRQWCLKNGARDTKTRAFHSSRHLLGSGVPARYDNGAGHATT